ncbi:MAG: hypothetical protein AAGJ18_08240 [Bacteroidota bacterium]
MDKLLKLFLGFLVLFALLIIALWTSDIPQNATGMVDTDYKTLLRSGETVATTTTTKWLAYFFGMGIIGIFGFVLFIGGSKRQTRLKKKMYRVVGIGLALIILVYNAMVNSWWDYTVTNSMDYFMGLPKPTAWMLFGLLPIPFFISFFYITQFEKWIYTKEDEEKFKEIMRNKTKK